jgi:hypothetical protein
VLWFRWCQEVDKQGKHASVKVHDRLAELVISGLDVSFRVQRFSSGVPVVVHELEMVFDLIPLLQEIT